MLYCQASATNPSMMKEMPDCMWDVIRKYFFKILEPEFNLCIMDVFRSDSHHHPQVDCSYLPLKLLNEKASTRALTGQSGVVRGNRPNKRPFIDFFN